MLVVAVVVTARLNWRGGRSAKKSSVSSYVRPEFRAGSRMEQGNPERTEPTVAVAAEHSGTIPRHGSGWRRCCRGQICRISRRALRSTSARFDRRSRGARSQLRPATQDKTVSDNADAACGSRSTPGCTGHVVRTRRRGRGAIRSGCRYRKRIAAVAGNENYRDHHRKLPRRAILGWRASTGTWALC